MLILSADNLRRAAPMALAMDAVADAFAQLASGAAAVPLRQHVPLGLDGELALVMPARLDGSSSFGVKALTLYPENPARHGLPAIAALVLLFETRTGQPLALVSGAALTALRTGAASGAATRLLARPEACVLALFGAGAQAYAQVEAVCAARPIERVWLANRTRERAERL